MRHLAHDDKLHGKRKRWLRGRRWNDDLGQRDDASMCLGTFWSISAAVHSLHLWCWIDFALQPLHWRLTCWSCGVRGGDDDLTRTPTLTLRWIGLALRLSGFLHCDVGWWRWWWRWRSRERNLLNDDRLGGRVKLCRGGYRRLGYHRSWLPHIE